MFTLEIGGRAIAVTDAPEDEARELFESQDFQDDLRSIESEGRPLWDGSAAFTVRPASEEEMDALDASLEEAEADEDEEDEDEDEEGDGINVLFLVPVDTMHGGTGLAN